MTNRWSKTNFKYTEPTVEYYTQELAKFDELLTTFCSAISIEKSKVDVNIKALKQIIRRVDMRW